MCQSKDARVEPTIKSRRETNMSEDILNRIWPEWTFVRQIGRGSYGVVYEAKKKDILETRAAIKIIPIPQNASELDSLRAEGLTEEEIRLYIGNIKDDFVHEIKLMYDFKATQNIVSIEDYKVVEKENEIGWDIFIRMELLTPFTTYVRNHTMNESEIAKLGIDICNALELCEKNNVIHRDIKPENIFVNKHGDFKLGDFGIARKLENVTGELSQKGAPNYMAPEVVHGTRYDNTVDIYSLGLVLYRLCNNNCLPFLDPGSQSIPGKRAEAVNRRMSGQALPRPVDASYMMWDIIRCACDPIASRRFRTAEAMKRALEIVLMNVSPPPISPKPPIPPVPPETVTPEPPLFLRVLVFVLAVILLAIICIAALSYASGNISDVLETSTEGNSHSVGYVNTSDLAI